MAIEVKDNKPERTGDTLDDLKSRDIDNLQYILKNKKRIFFKTFGMALNGSQMMMTRALEHCGMFVDAIVEKSIKDPEGAARLADDEMQKNDVRIESRLQYEGDDAWRRGTYIYHKGEIAHFIGQVRKHGAIHGVHYVDTTVPFDQP